MKVARLVDIASIKVGEERAPVVQEGHVKVKVNYCGICGSDLHAYKKTKGYEFVPSNVILGHEFSGIIKEVSNLQDEILIGKNVVVESQDYCNNCEYCYKENFTMCTNRKVIGLHYDGGLAEYVIVPRKNIIIIDDLAADIAALLEPVSVGVHALTKLDNNLSEKNILIQGPGTIGFFIGLLCKEKGANVWISGLQEDYETRLKLFEQFGLNTIIQGEKVPFENLDFLIECSGSSNAIFSNSEYLVKGGVILLVALYERESSVYFTPIIRNEWTVKTSYGSNPGDYEIALNLISKYQKYLNKIYRVYDFKDVDKAFKDALDKKILKALVKL